MRRQSYGRFLQSEMFHVIMKTTYASREQQQSTSKNPAQTATPLLTPPPPKNKPGSSTTRRHSLVTSVASVSAVNESGKSSVR